MLLARALLAAPAVLLLDEPTEGVDDEMPEALLADLLTAAGDATVLLVTHRTAGLDAMDAAVELQPGAAHCRSNVWTDGRFRCGVM